MLLKSGTQLSVETHAPQKKTILREFWTKSFNAFIFEEKSELSFLFIFVGLDKLILIISKIYPYSIEIVFVTIKIAKFFKCIKVYLFLNINYSVCQCRLLCILVVFLINLLF